MAESVTQKERLARLEEKTENIERKVDDIDIKLTKFIESAENKFSAKWVERAASWFVMSVVGAVLAALLALVIIKK